jgi:hypothetical protein
VVIQILTPPFLRKRTYLFFLADLRSLYLFLIFLFMRNIYKQIGFLLLLGIFSNLNYAQIQKGSDIDGEDTGDRSGWSVSMPDGNTVAIGAPQNDDNGGNSGQVRVYQWSGTAWTQKGIDLDGDAPGDLFGGTVCMPNANTLAVGAPENGFADTDAGLVKVFDWNGNAWTQKGPTLYGDSTPGFFGGLFGSSVSMPDANTLAVGAPWFDLSGSLSGQVKIFDWQGGNWVQRGASITGTAYSYTGSIVCMPSANVIGVVTQGATPGNKGKVQIFEWDGTQWLLKGNPIEGENTGDLSGSSMDMPDENTIAIGAIENDGGAGKAGHVRIFIWDGSAWIQKGSDIDGEAPNDESGNAVSMPDANTIAIGAILNGGNGMQGGHTRIFTWDGTDWVQFGLDIDGEAAQDKSGYSLSMPDANTVAIGAIQNDAVNGSQFKNEAGHVRIYQLSATFGIQEGKEMKITSIHPNPTKGDLTLDFGQNLKDAKLILRNVIGQEVWSANNISGNTWTTSLTCQPGTYYLQVQTENMQSTIKVIKE